MNRVFELTEQEMSALIIEALIQRGELSEGKEKWQIYFAHHERHPMSQAGRPMSQAGSPIFSATIREAPLSPAAVIKAFQKD